MKSKGVPGDPEKCAISRGGALVCAVFFIGVLLSGAVYYGISVIMGHTELCDGYYDGENTISARHTGLTMYSTAARRCAGI